MKPVIDTMKRVQNVVNDCHNLFDDNKRILSEWKTWALNAEHGTGQCRDIAFVRLKDCLLNRYQTLDLSYLSLTELPKNLPNTLKTLIVYHNKLVCLPNNLPNSLERIYADFNQLIALPTTLPINLLLPSLCNNQLTRLPNYLPASLRVLIVSNNQLNALPEDLPRSLQRCHANHNQLVTLPVRLPPFLALLEVNYNQLVSLPVSLPRFLVTLSAIHNPLIDLPHYFPISLRQFEISHNPSAQLPTVPLSFINALKLWDTAILEQPWQVIESEENAKHFAFFLQKLHQGLNRKNKTLRNRVCEWLQYLLKNENSIIRSQTFEIAIEAISSCVDRSSFYFNKMYCLMIENQFSQSSVQKPIDDVLNIALSLFRLQELDKIASEHAKHLRETNPGFAEDIEIHLAYPHFLRKALNLPIFTELQFEKVANLTAKDLSSAQTKISERESNHFLHYLLMESTIWREKIIDWNAKKDSV